MLEHVMDLFFDDARGRQGRQRMLVEEIDGVGLRAGSGGAAQDVAEEKELVGVIGNGRMTV